MTRTRKRRAPRMRQSISDREKLPRTRFGPGLVPKENKANRIWRRAWAQGNSSSVSRAPWTSPSLRHNRIDCDPGGHSPGSGSEIN